MLSGMLPQTNLGCVYLLMSLQPYQYGGIIQCHTGTGFRDIDFEPPFRRLEMIEALEDGAKLSLPKDLGSEETRNYLIEVYPANSINNLKKVVGVGYASTHDLTSCRTHRGYVIFARVL
ncbi:unnamed protein product [Cuscuta europaea]|uniref:Uncharacterized protein n=1 Tax=Cuscuta europaea TaxID=41803 RepID=A0A9P1E1T8_CUSEU|nr:unnamed protein product [Cuscuta europaea]